MRSFAIGCFGRTLGLSLALGLTQAGTCQVQAADERDSSLFSQLDRNSDGVIAADEVTGGQQSFFRRALRVADQNEDGHLSAAELQAATTDPDRMDLPGSDLAGRAAQFDPGTFDRNRDGKITADEVPPAFQDRFRQMLTAAGKSSFSPEEIRAVLRGERPGHDDRSSPEMAEEKMKESDEKSEMRVEPRGTERDSAKGKPAERAGKRPQAPRSEKGNGRPNQNEGAGAVFGQLDRNSDGTLSENEVPQRMKERFSAVDTDNNGKLSRQEFSEAIERRMNRD